MTSGPVKLQMISGRLDLAPPLVTGFTLQARGQRIPARPEGPTAAFAYDETGMVLSVVSMTSGTLQSLGTAFMVLPGLAMTSAHVIADYQTAGRLDDGLLLMVGAFGGAVRAWAVTRLRMPVEGDVALAELMPRFDPGMVLTVNHVELTARLPAVGEPVLAFGLIASAPEFPMEDAEGSSSITVQGLLAHGTVREIMARRDQALPGPTLECDFKAPGGMSGGPVFDRDGYVCGILSRSLELPDGWVSWVSLHWPGLMFPVQPEWPPTLYRQPGTLWPGHVAESWHLGIGDDRSIAYFEDG